MRKSLAKKEKIELIITGIGVVFLIFLVISNTQRTQSKRISTNDKDKAMVYSLFAPISFETAETKETEIMEGWGRDPFFLAAPGTEDIGLEGLILNGIVWDKDNPYAIVNSDIVKIGDKLGSMKVIEINENNIIVEEGNGKRHTIELNVN